MSIMYSLYKFIKSLSFIETYCKENIITVFVRANAPSNSASTTSYYNVNTFRFLIGKYFIVTSFLLEFTAFEKPISINLEPNRDLFHSEAKVTIFNTNGSTNKTELLRPQDHLVYKGLVNDRNHQWAQTMMRNDSFEFT
ncbi:hypothetical protein BD770DRAFT_410838 [Pilaira anomala]|nr:hypothetical protein BD770DRAFT_410838 [Pilaira anomala]